MISVYILTKVALAITSISGVGVVKKLLARTAGTLTYNLIFLIFNEDRRFP